MSDPPPTELVVDAKPAPGDSSDGGGAAMAPYAFPFVVGGLLAKYVSPLVGLAGVALAILFLVGLRKPREGRFVLRITDGVLEIARERGRTPPVRVPIADVLDVTLDRQTHQASGRGGSPTERVRIALERRAPSEPLFLPDERITPLEGQEWQGKVRVFLRKHDWVPRDERNEPSQSTS
jgi:hypothetical protein